MNIYIIFFLMYICSFLLMLYKYTIIKHYYCNFHMIRFKSESHILSCHQQFEPKTVTYLSNHLGLSDIQKEILSQ